MRSTIAALLFIAIFAAIVPTAEAQEADSWEVVVEPGLTEGTLCDFHAEGSRLGVMKQQAGTLILRFGLLDGNGYTLRNSDISGAAVGLTCSGKLIAMGGTEWIFAEKMSATNFVIYRSADDGATWALQTGTATSPTASDILAAAKSGNDLILLTSGTGPACGTCGSAIRFWKSSDDGASFTGGYGLTDNCGQPTGCTPTLSTQDRNEPVYLVNGNVHKIYWTSRGSTPFISDGATRLYSATSQDAGGFWTTPWSGNNLIPTMSATTRGSGSCTNFDDTKAGRNDLAYTNPIILLGPCDQAGTPGQGNQAYGLLRPFDGTTSQSFPPVSSVAYSPLGAATNNVGQTIAAIGSTGSDQVWYQSAPGEIPVLSYTFPSAAGVSAQRVGMTNDAAYVFYVNDAVGGQGEYIRAEVFTPPAGLYASVVLNNIVGFDVDGTGSIAIVRYEGGNDVAALNAGTLLYDPMDVVDTNCNRIEGVSTMASPKNGQIWTSYLQCSDVEACEGCVSGLRIRDGKLDQPDLPSFCGSFCITSIETDQLAGDQGETIVLRDLQTFPYDFTKQYNIATASKTVIMVWGFSTTDGRIGVLNYYHINNHPDQSEIVYRRIDVSNPITDLCTTYDGSAGRDLIYGASSSANVLGFEVLYHLAKRDVALFGWSATIDMELQPIFPGGVQTAGATDIGCGGKWLLVGQNEPRRVVLYDVTEGKNYQVASGGDEYNLMAIDPYGLIGAYQEGSNVHAFYTSNRTVFQTVSMPSGDPQDLHLDNLGKNVWIATDERIIRRTLDLNVLQNITANPFIDSDGDGTPNAQDSDIDGDGIPNSQDTDIDGDGEPNNTDTDDDGDGIPDTIDPAPGGTPTGPGNDDTDDGTDGKGVLGNRLFPNGDPILVMVLGTLGTAMLLVFVAFMVNRNAK